MPAVDRKVSISGMLDELEVLPTPGLRDIKAVELYTKWRLLLPEWARDSTSPRPSDEVIGVVKATKNAKVRARTKRKRSMLAIEEGKEET